MKLESPTLRTIARAAALAALAALALACGTGGGDKAGTEEQPAAGTTATGSGTPSVAPGASAIPMDGKTAQVYRDGFKLMLSAPTRYRVPAAAAGHTAGNSAFAFNVVYINNTAGPIDLTLTTLDVTAGADGVTAEPIYANGLDTLMDAGTLAPGRRKTLTLAFSADTKDLTVIDVGVKPGFLDYSEALFTGRVTR